VAPPPSPTSRPSDRDLVGRVLAGRYRLNRPIASGGMAQVWDATDQVLTRHVAVKILHPYLAEDDSFIRRFQAEAVAAARLAHPSIVSIYDTVSVDGLNAIVMELVVGTTMRADLDQHGPLKLHAVLAIGSQVADALGAAHAAGLVHRDVKPANILLSGDGRVLVADFGIAKAAEGADLTSDGSMVGTAKYLAPEQVEGGPVDGRADLYALGVVLYEALTGTVPFVADTDAGTALARLHRDPTPPRRLRPEIPEAVEAVILRALARRPADRFPDAASMRRALLAAGADPARAPAVAQAAVAASTDERLAVASAPRPATRPPPPPRAPATSGPRPAPYYVPHAGAEDVQPGRARRWPWLVVALLLGIGAVAGYAALTGTGLGDSPGRTIAISGFATLDPPPGDFEEVDDLLPAINDDDETTAWRTERYGSSEPTTAAGEPKGGVGLVVLLDESTDLRRIDVGTPAGGWSAAVHVHDRAGEEPPDDLAGWGDAVAEADDVGDDTVRIDLGGASGDTVLVWFTRLAPGEDGRHTAQITTVEVRGT
jgi:eukaryotic-like serine/threonine-protein kinase